MQAGVANSSGEVDSISNLGVADRLYDGMAGSLVALIAFLVGLGANLVDEILRLRSCIRDATTSTMTSASRPAIAPTLAATQSLDLAGTCASFRAR